MPINIFIEKTKIFLLYRYYLSDSSSFFNWLKQEKESSHKENQLTRIEKIEWLFKCLQKERELASEIENKLNEGWFFDYLPPLEKSILIYSSYEILFNQKMPIPSLINQIIEFSKKYLEPNKYGYINKVLDLLFKQKN